MTAELIAPEAQGETPSAFLFIPLSSTNHAQFANMATTAAQLPAHTPTPSSQSSAALIPDTGNLTSSFAHTNHDDILHHALRTIRFLELLGQDPNLDHTSAENTRPPILRHLYGFLLSTFHAYWGRLLPAKASIELGARLAPDADAAARFRADTERKFRQVEEAPGVDFDRNRWPDFEMEAYVDALGRNAMAGFMVVDEGKQGLFGGDGEGGVYRFSDEVKAFARELSEKSKGELAQSS